MNAERIKASRVGFGMTQAQAAKLLSVDERSWRRWEAGDRKMTPQLWELWKLKTARRGKR